MFIVFVLDENDGYVIQMIYAKNKKRLLNVAKSYLGSSAEDAVHDAFIKLIEKYDGKIEELRDKEDYFFVTIVKNHSIDIIRSEKHVEAFDMDENEDIFIDENEPGTIIESEDELKRMMDLIDRLKPKYRQVLEYKYILEYTNKEIAQILLVSPSVVSTRINRALHTLTELMEKEEIF